MRSYWKFIVPLALLGLTWFYLHNGSTPDVAKNKRDLPAHVALAEARKGTIDLYVNALGSVSPHNTVTVRSRVDGQLLKVHFQEGQMVKEGELLAEIDDRTYRAQLKQAEGQKMRDEALLQDARKTLERYKALVEKDSIPRQQMDTQHSLVKQYEGAVTNDQGQIENAATQLEYTRITAPISGRVGLRQVDPGNIVHSSDNAGIVVITEVDPMSVLFTIPEDRIPTLTKRMKDSEPLLVEAWNRESSIKLAIGKLSAVDNQVDATTGTLKLRADFANEAQSLFPNQFVNIRLKLETQRDALLVPSAAIQRGKNTFVYRYKNDNIVEAIPVSIGIVEGDNASLLGGITEGDKVVVQGGDSLHDGSKVVVSEASPDKESEPNSQKKGERHKKHE